METLYNGIKIPDSWSNVQCEHFTFQPLSIPYLNTPPEIINIDCGRQLFIDDFLIDTSLSIPFGSMVRKYFRPTKYSGNPIFFPETTDERNADLPPCAVAKSGGVWFDGEEEIYKMWYMSSYLGYASYAYSYDGVHWIRPVLDVVPGTNHVIAKTVHPDSGSVIIDYSRKDNSKYKMLLREPNYTEKSGKERIDFPAKLYTSNDGVHWDFCSDTGNMYDRSTMFYNPFRNKWVQSIRKYNTHVGRLRYYSENEDFIQSAQWKDDNSNIIPWLRADCYDKGDTMLPELYNFDAIAYESIMVGFPQILKGPSNYVGEQSGMPKLTELDVAYSRDGFHFCRPDRTPFISARRESGSWEYGYVESSAGMCLIVGDELWFYYTAYAGDPERRSSKIKKSWHYNGMYANGSVGLAKLRRDGFAAMCSCFPNSVIATRPVIFSGNKLFINANTAGSVLKAELLDINKRSIKGFSFEDCNGYCGNSTCAMLYWENSDLNSLAGLPVRIRFKMDRGELYSFWITSNPLGKSNGYVGAGGPGYTSSIDK